MTAMTATLDAAATDPKAHEIMKGFPAAPDKLIRLHDGSSWRFPGIRWSFSHQRELTPTVGVRRGPGPARELPYSLRQDLDAVSFTTQDGRPMNWGQSLAANYTDGILILHKGRIVYEKYLGALDAHTPHLAMSVTKSFVGLFAAMQAHAGELDPGKLVPHYVPELKDTAYGDATVRQVMDMTIGVQYSENYTDPNAEIFAYTAACGISPRRPDYKGPDSIFEFLQNLKKQDRHGEAFAYKTCNTEALAWIVQRVSGVPFAKMLSERLWQQLGLEEDAYVLVDRNGFAMCGGGLNMTLRDMARFGEMMRLKGAFNGRQIVPEAVVADIAGGADPSHFAKSGYAMLKGWSYRNQWWVAHDEFGAYTARGIHGQVIWIAPKAELVIARFASHPTAANVMGIDDTSLPAYAAIARHMMRG
jgi:CubicO group peptidase (beta-lactamase class C family)